MRKVCTLFSDMFERALFRRNEPAHVTAQEEQVGKAANHTEGRFPFQCITHERRTAVCFELMHVTEPLEGAFDHFINKTVRAIDFRNASDEPLSDAEVTAFKRNEITELKNTFHSAGLDNSLG